MGPYEGHFEQIRAYDVPGVLLSQAAGGTLSMGSAWQTFSEGVFGTDPALPPSMRQGPESLLGWQPDTALGRAFVNVATNPFTYLLLATELAMPRLAKGLFETAPRLNAWLQSSDMMPHLHRAGLSNLWQRMRGTHAADTVDEILRNTREWGTEVNQPTVRAIKDWMKDRGVKTLYMDNLAPGTTQRALVEEATTLLKVRRAKLHKNHTEAYLTYDKGGNPNVVYKEHKGLLNGVSDEALEKMVDNAGLRNVADAMDAHYDKALNLSFLGENGKVDRDKMWRMFSSMASSRTDHVSRNADETLAVLFSPDTAKRIASGEMSVKQFEKVLDTFDEVIQYNKGSYTPRNLFHLRRAGGELGDRATRNYDLDKGILEVSDSVLTRKIDDRIYDADVIGLTPDGRSTAADGGQLSRVFGDNALNRQALEEARTRYTKAVARATEDSLNRGVLTDRLDEFQSFLRYDDSISRTYAMYVKPPSQRLLDAQSRKIASVYGAEKGADEAVESLSTRAARLRGPSGRFDDGVQAFADIQKVAPESVPPGGFTNADLLNQAYSLLPEGGNSNREFLRDVIVPRLQGKVTNRDFISGAIATTHKNAIRTILKSPLKGLIGEASPDMLKQLEYVASEEMIGHRNYSYSIASYLYGSLLGLNVGAVAVNLTQPLLTTGRFVSTGALAKGYVRGIRDTIKYGAAKADDIAAGRTSALDELNLRKRVFGDIAEEAGILADVEQEILEGGLSPGAGINIRQGVGQKLNSVLLAPFQAGEVFNRVVTAHAGKAAAEAAGLSVNASKDTVRRLVSESQFVSDLVSSPSGFLSPNSVLSNNLVRQFLTFPIRMMTSPFETGATIGANPNTALGLLRDFTRGAALTAVSLETIRGLTNTDAGDQLGFFENTFALPNAVFDDFDGPIPVPPAFSVVAGVGNLVRGEDQEFFQRTLPLLVPAGLQASKIANLGFDFEQVPVVRSINPQKQFVDWDSPRPDGTVPYFKADGRLIGYETPATLAMRAFGLTFDKGDGDLDGYLVRQTQNIREGRAEYMRRLQANDVAGAQQVADSFEKKYGIPLTVSRSQMASFARTRVERRSERILRQLPPEMRERYAITADIDPNTIDDRERRRQRESEYLRSLSPEAQRELQAALARERQTREQP
jgi:hypothetical protein